MRVDFKAAADGSAQGRLNALGLQLLEKDGGPSVLALENLLAFKPGALSAFSALAKGDGALKLGDILDAGALGSLPARSADSEERSLSAEPLANPVDPEGAMVQLPSRRRLRA